MLQPVHFGREDSKDWWWGYFTLYHFCLPVWSVCGKWNTHVSVYPLGQSVKTMKYLLYGQVSAQQLFFSLLLVFILRGKQVWNYFSTHINIIKIQNFSGLHPCTLDPIRGTCSTSPQTPSCFIISLPSDFLFSKFFSSLDSSQNSVHSVQCIQFRCCSQNRKVPGTKPARRSARLRDPTSLRGLRMSPWEWSKVGRGTAK